MSDDSAAMIKKIEVVDELHEEKEKSPLPNLPTLQREDPSSPAHSEKSPPKEEKGEEMKKEEEMEKEKEDDMEEKKEEMENEEENEENEEKLEKGEEEVEGEEPKGSLVSVYEILAENGFDVPDDKKEENEEKVEEQVEQKEEKAMEDEKEKEELMEEKDMKMEENEDEKEKEEKEDMKKEVMEEEEVVTPVFETPTMDGCSLEETLPSQAVTITAPLLSSSESALTSIQSSPTEFSPAKNVKSLPKEEKMEEEDEMEENEEDEEMKGILDMPLVIEGSRKRQSTAFFKADEVKTPKAKAPTVTGSGTALADIPFIVNQIDIEKKVDDLRPFHRICYGAKRTVNKALVRRELKRFNGFPFAEDSDDFKKRVVTVNQLTIPQLTHVRRMLGLATPKDCKKAVEVTAIMEFLLSPHDNGKSLPKNAVIKRKSAGRDKAPAAKRSKKDSASVDTETEGEEGEEEKMEEGEEVKEEDGEEEAKKKEEKETESSPLDEEVKTKITELMGAIDHHKVSMSQCVARVLAAFPDHPSLKEHTSAIREFVKDLLKKKAMKEEE